MPNISGQWMMYGGAYYPSHPGPGVPSAISIVSSIPTSGVYPTGSLSLNSSLTTRYYDLSYNMIVAYDGVEIHLSREESGLCSVNYSYEGGKGIFTSRYWHGEIYFKPSSGAEWRANFRLYDSTPLQLDIFSIPAVDGTLELVWEKD